MSLWPSKRLRSLHANEKSRSEISRGSIIILSRKRLTARNRKEAEKRILKMITIKCKDCHDVVQFDDPEYRPHYCDNCGRKFPTQ
jgi:Zn finger protein HypA/HybF involved in hydrogenase expression